MVADTKGSHLRRGGCETWEEGPCSVVLFATFLLGIVPFIKLHVASAVLSLSGISI